MYENITSVQLTCARRSCCVDQFQSRPSLHLPANHSLSCPLILAPRCHLKGRSKQQHEQRYNLSDGISSRRNLRGKGQRGTFRETRAATTVVSYFKFSKYFFFFTNQQKRRIHRPQIDVTTIFHDNVLYKKNEPLTVQQAWTANRNSAEFLFFFDS